MIVRHKRILSSHSTSLMGTTPVMASQRHGYVINNLYVTGQFFQKLCTIDVHYIQRLLLLHVWICLIIVIQYTDSLQAGWIPGRKSILGLDALFKSVLFQKNSFFLIWIKFQKQLLIRENLTSTCPSDVSKCRFVKQRCPFIDAKSPFSRTISYFIIFVWNIFNTYFTHLLDGVWYIIKYIV